MATRSAEKKQIRKEKVQAERLGIFIADYVKHKYYNVYNEATQYFTMLREKNPSKLDLKKTSEYRNWVKQQTWIKHYVKNQQGDEQSVNIQQVDHGEHPQQVDHNEHPQQVDHDKHPHQVDHLQQSDEQPVNIQQVDHGEQPQKVDDFTDNLQLKIPLIDPGSLKTKELASTVETLAEGDINIEPSFEEILPVELLEEIINELREDPDLKKIMTDLEEQLLFEELDIGMEIELGDDDDRLEQELL